MKFIEHGVYLIRNWETRESQYFEAFEVLEYEGQYIVYGEVRANEIMVFRGTVPTPAKPVAFPVLPHALPSDLRALVVACGGLPLGISEVAPGGLVGGNIKSPVGEELLVPNCNSGLAKVWGGEPWIKRMDHRQPNRDGLIRKCTRQIDLYLAWRRDHQWPAWFLDDKRRAMAPVSRN